MSKIGYLKPVHYGEIEELHGEIKTLQIQLKVKFVPNLGNAADQAPDYIICATGYSGESIEIGAAWMKRKEQLGGGILEFLSITIDDPSLPTPLNVAAFPKDDGYEITWRRRQASKNAQDAA